MEGYDGTQIAVQGDPQYGQQDGYDHQHMGYDGYPHMPYFNPYWYPYYMHHFPFFPMPYGHGGYPMQYGQGGQRFEGEDRPFYGGFGHPFFGFHHHHFPFFFPFGFGFGFPFY